MRKVCLNFDWTCDFRIQEGIEYSIMSDDSTSVDLPYCVMQSSVYFCRTIKSEEISGATSVWMSVDGVQGGATVYINHIAVFTVAFGYESFDITDYLDKQHDNSIRIEVVKKNGSAGIAGGVHLLVATNNIVIPVDTLSVATVAIDNDVAQLEINVPITLIQPLPKGGKHKLGIFVEIFNHKGKRKGRKLKKLTLTSKGASVVMPLVLKKAMIYNLDSPYQYTAKVSIIEGGNTLETADVKFGIRMAGLRGRNFVFNSKSFKFNGARIDNTHGVLGAISIAAVDNERIAKVKECGYNIIRTLGFPTQTTLDICDKNGILCLIDLFDKFDKPMDVFYNLKAGVDKLGITQSLVLATCNHPSVIGYIVCDGTSETYGRGRGKTLIKSIVDKVKELDKSKLVTAVLEEKVPNIQEIEKYAGVSSASKVLESGDPRAAASKIGEDKDIFGQATKDVGAILDFVCYKNLSHRYAADSKAYPKRLFMGMDTAAKDMYQAIDNTEECLSVIGDMSYVGLFDYYGQSTPINEYRQILTGSKNKACIVAYDNESEPTIVNGQGSWNFPRDLGKPVKVDVFTSGDVVALMDGNNNTISRQLAGRRNMRKASFEVDYKPGDLNAVAYYKGSEHAKATLSGVSVAKTIKLTPSKKVLSLGNRRDMSIVDVSILDKEGRVVTYANREVYLMLSDNIQIMAVGNGASAKCETIQKPMDEIAINVVDGRSRFVVVGLSEGRAKIEAFCEGLLKSKLSINVK